MVNVDDFGAVGDGRTGNADAIEKACQADNLIEFTAGKTYYVERTIDIGSDRELQGNMARIVYDGKFFGLFKGNNNLINGFVFDGRGIELVIDENTVEHPPVDRIT